MANSVTASLRFTLSAIETIDLTQDLASDPTITHRISGTGFTSDRGLNASSTPAVSAVWADEFQLTDGDESFDLTDLTRTALSNVDMSGKKIQAFVIAADSSNSETITIKPHETNGYNLFGDADGQVTLGAGGVVMMYCPEHTPDVANGSADIIQVTSDDVDAKFKIILLAG